MKGWVYIISNKAMPNLVKVGFTLKDPELRAAELNNTGVPHPYVVDYEVLIEEPRSIEQKVHQLLSDKREGKEWFRTTPEEASATIKSVIGNNAQAEAFKHTNRQKADTIVWQKHEAEKNRIADDKYRREKIAELNQEKQQLSLRHKAALDSMGSDISFWFTYAGVVFVVIIVLELMSGQTGGGIWGMGAILSLVITPFVTGFLHNKEKEKPEYQNKLKKQRSELAELDQKIASFDNK